MPTASMELASVREVVAAGGPTPDQYDLLNETLDRIATLRLQDRLGAIQRLQHILAPTLVPETMQGLAYLKPRGYPGDFEIIDRMYQCWEGPHEHLQRWDAYFHHHAAARAVRNRKAYFIDYIGSLGEPPRRILNVASGPCRDLLEGLQQVETGHHITCLDIDPDAIAYAQALCAAYADRITFHRRHVLRYRPREPFDVIWSSGLFDYFDDRVFVVALRHLLTQLADGGECVIGNFSTDNPTRPYMEFVVEWYLHHRTPERLRELAVQAGAEPGQVAIRQEPLGVNLFLHVRRG